MRSNLKILILGGTSDACDIAAALVARGVDVTSSLAGATRRPRLPLGHVRSGGFGGAEGLARYLLENNVTCLIDATHPFATQISANAVLAAIAAHVALVRLERPPWQNLADHRWIEVPDIPTAVEALPEHARVFLAIGRKEFHAFTQRRDLSGVIRMIEPPDPVLPHDFDAWTVLLSRPQTEVGAEIELMRQHGVTHLVTKNAGGPARHKIDAAAQLGVKIVMVARPVKAAVPVPHHVCNSVAQVLGLLLPREFLD